MTKSTARKRQSATNVLRAAAAEAPKRLRSDGNVTETTYRKLLDLIESRQLAPGEVIEERRLALRLKVSRTPLRAGISRLLGEGRLDQRSTRGPTG
ncbi:GntR family transcriptional regulator [Bradyrhizobium liaoningense]|uniref:GntR family transcriptional regulator n=1 Tax=Bradyrhizobium liaoningense TaxID=43992 RepID=UPI001BA7CCB7|nr:GntR family transcriptional regulator [Bradyrhizobium liaoningense]MBR0823815.1 GntR family transcriptional regulator [Bradyrhizobium liaoningense]